MIQQSKKQGGERHGQHRAEESKPEGVWSKEAKPGGGEGHFVISTTHPARESKRQHVIKNEFALKNAFTELGAEEAMKMVHSVNGVTFSMSPYSTAQLEFMKHMLSINNNFMIENNGSDLDFSRVSGLLLSHKLTFHDEALDLGVSDTLISNSLDSTASVPITSIICEAGEDGVMNPSHPGEVYLGEQYLFDFRLFGLDGYNDNPFNIRTYLEDFLREGRVSHINEGILRLGSRTTPPEPKTFDQPRRQYVIGHVDIIAFIMETVTPLSAVDGK